MDESVIVALIALVGSLGGTFGGILVGSKLLTYRVEQLEKKVEKHNNLIERTYKLELNSVLHDEQLKNATERIERIENRIA